jgi:hypothetical protein
LLCAFTSSASALIIVPSTTTFETSPGTKINAPSPRSSHTQLRQGTPASSNALRSTRYITRRIASCVRLSRSGRVNATTSTAKIVRYVGRWEARAVFMRHRFGAGGHLQKISLRQRRTHVSAVGQMLQAVTTACSAIDLQAPLVPATAAQPVVIPRPPTMSQRHDHRQPCLVHLCHRYRPGPAHRSQNV